MPELSIFLTSARSKTNRLWPSPRRRVIPSFMVCSGVPMTREPTGTTTVTSLSCRTSIFIELTGTVAISLIDHEDEDAGYLLPGVAPVGRSASHHRRHCPKPAGAVAGGVDWYWLDRIFDRDREE